MSGPDLNAPAPSSNAIGLFQIGSSPIGTIPPFDWWRTVISQYANSPRLTAMIQNFFGDADQTRNFDLFYDLIKNIDTAQGYGLDLWGRILAVNRVLRIGVGPRFFGFEEGLPDFDPFNVSPFYAGEGLTENYAVSDAGFRVMLLAKAFSNICDASIGAINRILTMLFGASGKVYVVDNLDMTMTYYFTFVPTALQLAIIENSGVMPRPAGVSASVVHP
jgi:Protein of unknown function (DUF2612)